MVDVSDSVAVPFQSYASIPRLKRGCVITEKIDGTNAQVYIGEDGQVLAGSSNRWITALDDNYGFAGWVWQHAEELRTLGPGRHYGEWYGHGIQRKYGLVERRFALFNPGRYSVRPACCGIVPVLFAGEFTTDAVDMQMLKLKTFGSVAVPGFMNPEGVVVFMPQSNRLFKVTFDDKHKGETNAQIQATVVP